jgi:hypothetical protein
MLVASYLTLITLPLLDFRTFLMVNKRCADELADHFIFHKTGRVERLALPS